jgi:hypothetical protein
MKLLPFFDLISCYLLTLENVLERINKMNITNSNHFQELIDNKKLNQKTATVSFRVFLNYLEESQIIENDLN